jgi:hypothetical protein
MAADVRVRADPAWIAIGNAVSNRGAVRAGSATGTGIGIGASSPVPDGPSVTMAAVSRHAVATTTTDDDY